VYTVYIYRLRVCESIHTDTCVRFESMLRYCTPYQDLFEHLVASNHRFFSQKFYSFRDSRFVCVSFIYKLRKKIVCCALFVKNMLRIGFPSFEKIYTAFLFKYVFIFSFLQNFWLKIESHCQRFGQKSSAWIIVTS